MLAQSAGDSESRDHTVFLKREHEYRAVHRSMSPQIVASCPIRGHYAQQ